LPADLSPSAREETTSEQSRKQEGGRRRQWRRPVFPTVYVRTPSLPRSSVLSHFLLQFLRGEKKGGLWILPRIYRSLRRIARALCWAAGAASPGTTISPRGPRAFEEEIPSLPAPSRARAPPPVPAASRLPHTSHGERAAACRRWCPLVAQSVTPPPPPFFAFSARVLARRLVRFACSPLSLSVPVA
jgi:hypothetical protein